MSFAKNLCKKIGENIGKNLTCKQSQKHLDHAKKSATDDLKLKTASNGAIQKIAEAAGDLIGNKIADNNTPNQPSK